MASIEQTKSKVRSFQSLPEGWYYGEGGAIGFEMREKALNLLRLAERYGIKEADAFPSPNGQIGLSFYITQQTLAITIELDETYNVIEDIRNKVIYDAYEISEAEAEFKLWEFSQIIRIMSASSTLNTGNLSAIDSIILHLSVLQQQKTPNKGYPLFLSDASEIQIDPFANTSETTLPMW